MASSEEIQKAPAYFIDTTWYEENALSFETIAQGRMCESCRGRAGEEVEERESTFDQKKGRMKFEVRTVRYGANPMRVIRDCCSKRKNYIVTDVSTLEAVFRIYLASENQPMPLAQVRELLQDWCPGGGCQWLLLTDDQMERVLARDSYYGLREHQMAVPS